MSIKNTCRVWVHNYFTTTKLIICEGPRYKRYTLLKKENKKKKKKKPKRQNQKLRPAATPALHVHCIEPAESCQRSPPAILITAIQAGHIITIQETQGKGNILLFACSLSLIRIVFIYSITVLLIFDGLRCEITPNERTQCFDVEEAA